MKTHLAISIIVLAGALSACTTSKITAESTGGASTPLAPEAAVSDLFTGVSSTLTIYPVTSPTVLADAFEPPLAGTASPPESREIESSATFKSLLGLKGIESGLEISSIIGSDDRTKVADTRGFPERTMVLIALPGGRCSGALIGKDLVLTAGHCVHSGAGGAWMKAATIYPGRNGSSAPFGSCRAKTFYSVKGWAQNGDPNYDFGAIKLDCSIGTTTGWIGFWTTTGNLVGVGARISSYPGDKPLEQWTHSDSVRQQTDLKTYYATDTMPGNSGSAVIAGAGSGAPAGCTACAHTVHAYGGSLNSGTRISKPLFDLLVKWKAE